MEHRDSPDLRVISNSNSSSSIISNGDAPERNETNTNREVLVTEHRDSTDLRVISNINSSSSIISNGDAPERNETSTNRRNCIWSIFLSCIVHPATAGNLLEDESRDGQISSLVSLQTAVGILVVLMYLRFGSTSLLELQIKYDIVQILIIILLVMSILIYLLLIFSMSYKPDTWKYSESKRKHTCLKMAFIVIFTPCNIVYLVIKIPMYVYCTANPEYKTSLFIHIAYECVFILFLIIQIGFMCMSSGKCMSKSCPAHYAATIVIASNVAIVFYNSLKTHFEESLHHDEKIECFNQTMAFSIYDSTKVYLEPTVIENALLCILVIAEIFSMPDDDLEDHTTTRSDSIKCKVRCAIVLSFVSSVPYFVIRILLLHNSDSSNTLYFVQACSFVFLKGTMYMIMIKCFHLLRSNSRESDMTPETPLRVRRSNSKNSDTPPPPETPLSVNHYLILFSALGSEVFYGLNFAASINKARLETIMYAINNVLQFITTFVQTVLLIQMKDYKKMKKKVNDEWVSVACLFLALVNFYLWLYVTFLAAVYFDNLHYTTLFYGKTTTLTMRHLFVPMVIFYRFKCFLSFFELSTVTPPFVNWLLGFVNKIKTKIFRQIPQNYQTL